MYRIGLIWEMNAQSHSFQDHKEHTAHVLKSTVLLSIILLKPDIAFLSDGSYYFGSQKEQPYNTVS